MSMMRWNEDEARRLILGQMVSLIDGMRTQAIRSSTGKFRKREPISVFRPQTLQELMAQVDVELEKLTAEHGQLRDFAECMRTLLQRLPDASLLEMYDAVMDASAQWLGDVEVEDADGQRTDAQHPTQLEEVSLLLEDLRRERRKPTRREKLAIHMAHEALANGARLQLPYKPLPIPGFGETQTHMSVTDPGEGHLAGTTTREDWLRGVLVHVEHLERGHQDRESVESYRIPRILNVAKVRLHVAGRAPVTSFIGRPMFDSGKFHLDLWKTVQTMSGTCTAMFQMGVAECKVAMDRMTASQIVEFMRGLRSNILRDARKQLLSAAFNLNTPLVDDRNGRSRIVVDRKEIGLLGIELVKEGGFDKVTWDGAADTYPSLPVMEQLTHAEALELVHRAHERGLRTYFSAGFRFPHIPLAVYTGVDGVGIGGAQILRYMDSQTGYHGPFQPENISRILAIRDEAARSPLGRAAALLARLDWLHFQRRLDDRQEAFRAELYEALSRQQVESILQDFEAQSESQSAA
ncbi:hypothetical protein NR798_12210 [Archangium gephyra]|uniref:hypothetical protein n=1 Tax=Archangium gephyra TaxID=48 RepID=UPI0035D3E12A